MAKGTVEVFVEDLQYEGNRYRNQRPGFQGEVRILVDRGNIALDGSYSLDVGMRIIHEMLLSRVGDDLYSDEDRAEIAGFDQEVQRTMRSARSAGVRHGAFR